LESLSLVELPKGNGIVTRCPLVLRLRKSNERRVLRLLSTEYGSEEIVLNEKELNMANCIEQETNKLAGTNKNVTEDIIELQVEDPDVRDLTVVDLPGIAHNPIGGQTDDIYEQTVNLIHQFIDRKGSIILCVFPVNVDIATVQSFKLARTVDPNGERTIGVITKSDLAPNKDLLVQQLLMHRPEVLHLKLGFVAVRNRTSKEKISLQEAGEKERQFFKTHPASTITGWNCVGINALINSLANLYSDRVREIFPKLKADIQHELNKVREELLKYPVDLQTNTERLYVFHEAVNVYVEEVLKSKTIHSEDARLEAFTNILHGKLQSFRLKLREQLAELFSD
jgi:Dynamin family/Dynamin central region